MVFMLGGLVALVVILLVVFIPSMEKYTKDDYFWEWGEEVSESRRREGCRSWCNKARWTGARAGMCHDQCLANCGALPTGVQTSMTADYATAPIAYSFSNLIYFIY